MNNPYIYDVTCLNFETLCPTTYFKYFVVYCKIFSFIKFICYQDLNFRQADGHTSFTLIYIQNLAKLQKREENAMFTKIYFK